MRTVLSIAIDALAYGMVLFVISIGLSIMMGLMRVVNLAHGAFAMIGGYVASYAIRDLGLFSQRWPEAVRVSTQGEPSFAPYAGGAVMNTAIALGRLGSEAGFLTGPIPRTRG